MDIIDFSDLHPIEFSEEVRALAKSLPTYPKAPLTIDAILHSGDRLHAAQCAIDNGISADGRDKINQWIAIERSIQKTLAEAGIVDNESAISYLTRVAPILTGWQAQYQALNDRHSEELRDLLNDMVID